MSLVTIQGNASGTGTLTIAAPNTNSNYTLTLPTATTTLVGTDATQTLTNKTLTSPSLTTATLTTATLTTPNINSAPIPTVSGTAPLYMCRAWVNFNGQTSADLAGTYTRTSPSTTLTVTATAHGLVVGNSVNLDFTSGTALDDIYTVVTVADANTFTITTVASTTTSGGVTLLRNSIRGSGNVSSITDNGTGNYTVNFTTAMPDANYSAVATANQSTSTGATGAQQTVGPPVAGTQTTSAVDIVCKLIRPDTSAFFDDEQISVAIFR